MPRAMSPSSYGAEAQEMEIETINSDSAERWKYKGKPIKVRDVWAHNLEDELALIREVIENYQYVAMDTEFPGQVLKPIQTGSYNHKSSAYSYFMMKANVDILNLIQIGFTFFDEEGNIPMVEDAQVAWQFNFREFDPSCQPHAKDSVELLEKSGIDFTYLQKHGVEIRRFAELLTISGVVLNEDMKWVTFHSMYDFGYLLKCLMGKTLPESEKEFFSLLKIYFPTYYDMKHLMRYGDNLWGGLANLASHLQVERYGNQHQAGSDSLLTSFAFTALVAKYFQDSATLLKHEGVLYGLNDGNYSWQDKEEAPGMGTPSRPSVRVS